MLASLQGWGVVGGGGGGVQQDRRLEMGSGIGEWRRGSG